MSKNIDQVFVANPITSNASTDLMYFGQSPYGVGNDAAMTYSNFAAQFGAPYTAAALTKADDTNVTLTLGGTPATALLHAASITAGWTGTLSGTRGGTGVNNGASTITLGGSLTTSGAFASTFTMTNTTSVTFPTSGTLATTSQLPSASALTKTDDTNVTLTLGGTPATALLQATSITAGWTGQLGLTRGGTAASLTASNGGIVYSGASALAILSGTATASKMLLSGSSTTPTWSTSTIPTSSGATANKVLLSDGTNYVLSTPTFPNASATTRKIIVSDGTNWVASTETYAVPGTSGHVMTSDGTNWISSAPAAGGSPAGANNDIQFNESGAFTADTGNFTWNPALHSLNCGDGTNNLKASYNYFFGTGNTCSGNQTTSTYCMAIGIGNSIRSGANCMLVGGGGAIAQTNSAFGIAWGNGCIAGGFYSYAFGHNTSATGNNSFVTGFDATSNSHDGCFVAGDSQATGITGASADDQCVLAFVGGFYYQQASGNVVVVDTVGNLTNIKGTADQSYSLQAPSTGFTITMAATSKTLILNPAGTLATGTINLPASPIDGQEVRVTSSHIITSLTVSGNGNSIVGAPTSLAVGLGFAYIYNASGTTWYRLY